jgi:RNA 2',3'-cyclic 3'-phosphodiesterase
MKKRIYIGIPVSDHLKQKIKDWRTAHSALGVQWLRDEDLHITLVPPWYEDNLDDLKTRIAGIKNFSPSITVDFQCVTSGPDSRNPRFLWLLGTNNERLATLQKEVGKMVINRAPQRAILPHITLCRFKSASPEVKPMRENFLHTEEVSSIAIYESLGNSRYCVLATYSWHT